MSRTHTEIGTSMHAAPPRRMHAAPLPCAYRRQGPKARPIPAWGAAPGPRHTTKQGLKARPIATAASSR